MLGVFIGMLVLTMAAADTFGGLWTYLGVSILCFSCRMAGCVLSQDRFNLSSEQQPSALMF